MKSEKFRRMKKLVLILALLPILCDAQQNLSGNWRLKERKTLNGPTYSNAIAKSMTIKQDNETITIDGIFGLGDRDTLLKETVMYGSKPVTETVTRSGKRKTVVFNWDNNQKTAERFVTIYSIENAEKKESTTSDIYILLEQGNTLKLSRYYEGKGDLENNQNYSSEAIYEKITPEKLAVETATGRGIKFIEGLGWDEIQAKAKKDNKYIFVDCYATWCAPCKKMDKDIYPLNMIGDAINKKFIAVKVQMDSTDNDEDHIRLFYPVARQLEKDYKISGLPTYLFFSPDGKIVHKDMGQKKAQDFIALLLAATNPDKQLFTLINAAREKKMDYSLVPGFIDKLNENGDKTIAIELARVYMKDYLEKLSIGQLCSKKNLDFLWSYQKMLTTKDIIYDLCSMYPQMVDSVYGQSGWASWLVQNTLIYEFVLPAIDSAERNNHEPKWNSITKKIIGKSNRKVSETVIIDSKHYWYTKTENWEKSCEYLILKTNRTNSYKKSLNANDAYFYLNTPAWTIFEYSFKRKYLEEALQWVEHAISLFELTDDSLVQANILDTKANLLYKLGKKKEAVDIEEKVVALSKQSSDLVANFNKMIKGEPTWKYGVKENKRIK
jgi:thioredoxin-related protein